MRTFILPLAFVAAAGLTLAAGSAQAAPALDDNPFAQPAHSTGMQMAEGQKCNSGETKTEKKCGDGEAKPAKPEKKCGDGK